jgi:hypothetical protein
VKPLVVALLLAGCAVHAPRDMDYLEAVSRVEECRLIYPTHESGGVLDVFGLVGRVYNALQFSDCIEHYGFSSGPGR